MCPGWPLVITKKKKKRDKEPPKCTTKKNDLNGRECIQSGSARTSQPSSPPRRETAFFPPGHLPHSPTPPPRLDFPLQLCPIPCQHLWGKSLCRALFQWVEEGLSPPIAGRRQEQPWGCSGSPEVVCTACCDSLTWGATPNLNTSGLYFCVGIRRIRLLVGRKVDFNTKHLGLQLW